MVRRPWRSFLKEGVNCVFYKDDDGNVFHTYFSYALGPDMLTGAYHLLDLVPKGRDEAGLPWTMAWVRHHDKYGD